MSCTLRIENTVHVMHVENKEYGTCHVRLGQTIFSEVRVKELLLKSCGLASRVATITPFWHYGEPFLFSLTSL